MVAGTLDEADDDGTACQTSCRDRLATLRGWPPLRTRRRMKVLEAVRLIRADYLGLQTLWTITTQPERVQIALILGCPSELPQRAATPELAWQAMNLRQRRLVLAHAPLAVRARLPDDPGVRRCTTRRPPDAASRVPRPVPALIGSRCGAAPGDVRPTLG